VAEWLCRTSDRHIVLRVPGSSAHLRRGAPAANSFRLCGVLQSSAHALGNTERCALASSRPTIWRYRRHSDPGWTAPPIRPDMIFGKDRHACVDRTRGYHRDKTCFPPIIGPPIVQCSITSHIKLTRNIPRSGYERYIKCRTLKGLMMRFSERARTASISTRIGS